MRRALVLFAAVLVLAACVPPPPPTYLFDDEFNGATLSSAWQPNWLGPNNTTITKPVNGAELSCYDPAQVSVSGGNLNLTAAKRSCKDNNGKTYAYASGLVNTHSSFTFTDGHLEARVFIPGNGSTITNWPAVWTDGTGTWPQTGESDVMEGLSGKACFHEHTPNGAPGGCVAGDFTGWHIFAEDVRGSTNTYYYDGVKVGSETNTQSPQFLILNLGVGGFGGPISTPSTMLIDWIRVSA